VLVKAAQDTYGYQVGTRQQFAQAMAQNPILEQRHLIVPQTLSETGPPTAPILQDIINVADPKPYC
jgi:hypothetical protein